MSIDDFNTNTNDAAWNWKEACGDDKALKAYLTANVVHDEFDPRQPDQADIIQAKKQMQKANGPSLFEQDKTPILPSAPDGPSAV